MTEHRGTATGVAKVAGVGVASKKPLYSDTYVISVDSVKAHIGDLIKDLATRRVQSEGRDLVTGDDVGAILPEALQIMLDQSLLTRRER